VLAVQFLTRLPVPDTSKLTPDEVATGLVRAVAWFPLVGALVGAITAGIAVAAHALWPPLVAVLLALAIEARLTGAFHEDAVADFCDAFGGGHSRDDIRRIMKDSRIGSYGALGLLLAVGLRAALMLTALETLPAATAAAVIIAAASLGRLAVVCLMALVAPAPGGGGLAKDIGTGVGGQTLALGVLLALPGLAGLALLKPASLLAGLGLAVLFLLWFRALLLRRIGGSTGDCLGFCAYAGQLIALLAATAS
jgi:adenosylcobinamide-GDP ribazoletransferase